ncbi:hypothetical protein DYBT9623_02020 [Dyadobacter sp. CECT 9623]|uniref:Glycogen synthase n=1 Tax=Dyadobacter linearis TaxID=2823330 RepID=A0ABM8UPA5_9BACT|nr:glycosyltransferase [Dyadobacter sp. CECT 9623]CAG5069284.1 hypothetical protein DYBT9623_02020 [Dyadobacter sp. CECT 9623]
MKPDTYLFEISWEVCNQIGGLFTYIRSKIPTMLDTYGDRYLLIGPYFSDKSNKHFRPLRDIENPALAEAVRFARELGFKVHYGYWMLEDARPKVLLIEPVLQKERSHEVKARLWSRYGISSLRADSFRDEVIAFGEITRMILEKTVSSMTIEQDLITHFHEWVSAGALPDLHYDKVRIATIFNAHATLLGRYLAANEDNYFQHIPEYDWQQKAYEYGIEGRVGIERAAAREANVLVTNSDVTSQECEFFFHRVPDYIIRNGIHKKPGAGHEVFEKHLLHRQKIDAFVKSLITPSYSFQTDKVLYFFTSGRYEYYNKGFDITLRAIAKLNEQLIASGSDISVVFFIISKRPFIHIKPEILESKKRFQDLQKICKEISKNLGPQLYSNVIGLKSNALPDLNNLLDEELYLTWRQAKAQFQREELPPAVTHLLEEPDHIVDFIHDSGLDNSESSKVKIVYHPDFIDQTTSPLSMDYLEFVRGCHLGIFPSLYEPWGYAPMEAAMHGTPVITSDLSGFGRYIQSIILPENEEGIQMLHRRYHSDEEAVNNLTYLLSQFVDTFEKEHYVPRVNLPKSISDTLCWTELMRYYRDVYRLALIRHQPIANLY